MKNLIILLLLSISMQNANAQASGNYNYNNPKQAQINIHQSPLPNAQLLGQNTIIFNINALINEKADAHLAIFNMVQVGATAAEANDLVKTRYDAFLKEAIAAGVDKKDIYIDMVSLVPVYEYQVEKRLFSKSYNEIPKGFELQKNIHVVYKGPQLLDLLVTIAADQEIYDLVKVEYFVEDTERVYDELRDKCVAFANKKLASFKKLGIDMDTTFRIFAEAQNVAYPIERYKSFQAFSSSSVEATKKRHTITTVPKKQSMFYEKLPYNGYDIVINPVILEPAIQYTYNLKVQFYIEHPPKQPQVQVKREKEFLWLTGDGEIKSLKVE